MAVRVSCKQNSVCTARPLWFFTYTHGYWIPSGNVFLLHPMNRSLNFLVQIEVTCPASPSVNKRLNWGKSRSWSSTRQNSRVQKRVSSPARLRPTIAGCPTASLFYFHLASSNTSTNRYMHYGLAASLSLTVEPQFLHITSAHAPCQPCLSI